ncbi:MAG: endonuclease domain-containing protein [Chloroflexi bacterium]|nr:endonuclease domain-containing protein [Chloroflexota bacterium]
MDRWRLGGSVTRRRDLRAAQTDAERRLWRLLGDRSLGVKFRRQHSVGRYVLDLYCASAKLAVEIDGDGHAVAARKSADYARAEYLSGLGIRVIRFTNSDVLTQGDAVLDAIRRTLTLPSPAAAGEG